MSHIRYIIFLTILIPLMGYYSCKQSPPEYRFIDTESGIWELVWNDEFDYTGLPSPEKWNLHTISKSEDDNHKENIYVENGILTLKPVEKRLYERQDSLAQLTTKQKGDWKYGRIEIRAKLPGGTNTWAAMWMLPTESLYGNWPKSGEIDIIGHEGINPDSIYTSIHTEKYNHLADTCVDSITQCNTAISQFHVYSIEWEENEIRSYIDDRHCFTFYNDKEGQYAWPFDQNFYLLINLVNREKEQAKEDIHNSEKSSEMEIDYVRVYKKMIKNV